MTMADKEFTGIHAAVDGGLCRLEQLPDRTDVSALIFELSDSKQYQRQHVPKLEMPEVDRGGPETVLISGDRGVGGRTSNVYVDDPTPADTTKVDYAVSTLGNDVKSSEVGGGLPSASNNCSIICQRCGGCRCERCSGSSGRELPGLWCGPRCGHCTPTRVVDVVSCVCCVNAAVYHCSSADHVELDVDDCPCSCSGSTFQCRRRWACLALLGGLGCLPCLLLYWPLRALVAAVRAAYNLASRRHSCRCHRSTHKNTLRGRLRLLLVDTDSSRT